MELQTKFKVNDLVTSKYSNPHPAKKEKGTFDRFLCFEVIEVKTVTCSAGTQTFYHLRAIHALQLDEHITFFPEPDVSRRLELREDELILVPEATRALLQPKQL